MSYNYLFNANLVLKYFKTIVTHFTNSMYVAYICILNNSGVKILAIGRFSFQASKKKSILSWSLGLN